MVYRASIELDNAELFRELTLRWNTYSKTISIHYPDDNLSDQVIPSSATGLPSDLKYNFNHIETNPYNNLLVESSNRYEFKFEATETGEQESDKEWGLEGLIIESDRYYPLEITNDMVEFRLEPMNKSLYAWSTYDYHILNSQDPDEPFTVYTYSSSPKIGDEVFTSRGEPLSNGMYILAPDPYNLQNMVIASISGSTVTLGNKT